MTEIRANLTAEDFAERLERELDPEVVSGWPQTTEPVIEAAALRVLGLRVVDSADEADRQHWIDRTEGGAIVRVVLDDGRWRVVSGA